MGEAVWLARREIRRTSTSYPRMAAILAVAGVMGATVLTASAPDSGPAAMVAADIFLLAVCQSLVCNLGSRDSWVSPAAATSDRVLFLRSLPISGLEIAASRAISRIPVVILNSAALFLPTFVLVLVFGDGPVLMLTPIQYVWFTLLWMSYGLIFGSWVLFGELTLHGRTHNRIQWMGVLPFFGLIFFLEFVLDIRFVETAVGLAQHRGPLAAALGIITGIAVSTFWVLVTARKISRRDLVA